MMRDVIRGLGVPSREAAKRTQPGVLTSGIGVLTRDALKGHKILAPRIYGSGAHGMSRPEIWCPREEHGGATPDALRERR
jgi:hypothetical protein